MDVRTYNAIEPVAGEWDALAERTDAPPWLRPGWIDAWWRAFGPGELEILTLSRAGEPLALLPLVRSRGALSSPTNWHTPDFRLLAADAEAKDALARTLYGAGRRRITLGFIDEADASACRPAARANGYRLLERTLENPPFVPTDGDAEAYWASMDTKVMSESRRRRRRLEELGEVAIEVEDGRERLGELLEDGFRVEASGWKAKAGTAIVSREETRRFYTEVAELCAERGWLRLAFLRVGGRAVAFQLLVEHGRVLSQLKGGFDEEYRKYAPGTLLLQAVIVRAFESDVERYEFLGADEPFKLAWATATHDRRILQAFAPSLAGLADRAAFAYGRPLAKRARGLLRR